jgi:hypothetical protein
MIRGAAIDHLIPRGAVNVDGSLLFVEKVGMVLLAMFLKMWYTLTGCQTAGYGGWELSRRMVKLGWGNDE